MTDNIFGSPCVFCEESLGKINTKDVGLFLNGAVHEFYRLKALTLYFSGRKKNKNLNEQNFDGEANWSVVINVHCMQRVL